MKKDVVVIYKSIYGATKKYAEWIAKETDGDIFEVSKINIKDTESYSTIIYGGGLYASGISGISFVKKNFSKLKDKNIIVFTVGLANPKNTTQFEPIIEKNFTEDMKKLIKIFHFRGYINYKNLSIIHKTMMYGLKKSISNMDKDKITEEVKAFLDTYGKEVDFTNRDSIKALIDIL